MSRGSHPLAIAALLLASAALLAGWALVVPHFEGPDETLHWQFARYLHDHRRLPVYGPEFREANSPPLYYALIAPLAADGPTPAQKFRRLADGRVAIADPPRFYEHRRGDLQRFWRLTAARLVSVAIALVALVATALAAASFTSRWSTALLAAGLLLALPQFGFRASQISNDVLVAAFGALATWRMMRLAGGAVGSRQAVLAGLCVGLAVLSKTTAICLAPALAVACVVAPAPWPVRLSALWRTTAAALLVTGPWLLRNVWLYGDPLVHDAMRTAVPDLIQERTLTDPYFRTVFPSVLFQSFVGRFGHLNILLPRALYALYAGLAVAVVAGFAIGTWRSRIDWRRATVLASLVGANLVVVVVINQLFQQPQGRYLFPSLAAIAVAAAVALETLTRGHARVAASITVALIALHAGILLRVVMPIYWPPSAIDPPFYDSAADEAPTQVRAAATHRVAGASGTETLWTIDVAAGRWSAKSSGRTEVIDGFGQAGDEPLLGDMTGDGRTDAIVWKGGRWAVRDRSSAVVTHYALGEARDTPMVGRFLDPARLDLAVWTPSSGTWTILQPATGGTVRHQLGQAGDVPVPADYDADGRTDVAVWRPAGGTWHIVGSRGLPLEPTAWGQAGDVPVPGNYLRSPAADLAVYRPSVGVWYLRDIASGATETMSWGVASDVPVPVDPDGSGQLTPAVWRPSTATWRVLAHRRTTSITLLDGTMSSRPAAAP